MNKRAVAGGLAALVALGLAACSSGGGDATAPGSEETTSLKVVQFPIPDFAPVWVADKQGYFADESLDVTYDAGGVKNAADVIPLLVSGTYELALSTAASTVQARSQGLDISMVLGSTNYGQPDGPDRTMALVARTDGPQSYADLGAGSTVGVNGLNGATHVYAMKAIDDGGGDPFAIDYQNVPNESAAELILNGSVDASNMQEPFLSVALENPELHVVGWNFENIPLGTNQLSFVAETEWATSNSEVLDRFESAIDRAVEWLMDPNNRDEADQIISEGTGMPLDVVAGLTLPYYSTEIDDELLAEQLQVFLKYRAIDDAPPPSEILLSR